jgi:hypothetical protein
MTSGNTPLLAPEGCADWLAQLKRQLARVVDWVSRLLTKCLGSTSSRC